jgi:hypothetical protein
MGGGGGDIRRHDPTTTTITIEGAPFIRALVRELSWRRDDSPEGGRK